MYRGSKLRNYKITKLQNRSRGYILITMMLFLSLLAMAALAVLPDIALQVKRDREEELIHRGLGYSRGIRRFYKKFGRYPTKIEDLENTNTLRFIRQRYKDPVTGEDFKILRIGDVGLSGLMMGGIPGQNFQGAPGVTLPGRGTPGSNLGQGTGQQIQIMTNTDTTNAAGGNSGTSPATQTNPNPSASSSPSNSSDLSSSTQQVFGGGPMVGVVSTNQAKTIREFCKKSHYKDWYFIYDPTNDRGGALTTPWCPGLGTQGFGANPIQPAGGQAPPNPRSPQGGVPPTQNPPSPGAEMPPEQ
jgi:type II secretory pathway pseudopilin PulG